MDDVRKSATAIASRERAMMERCLFGVMMLLGSSFRLFLPNYTLCASGGDLIGSDMTIAAPVLRNLPYLQVLNCLSTLTAYTHNFI